MKKILYLIIFILSVIFTSAYYEGQIITQQQLDRVNLNNLSWEEAKDLFSCMSRSAYYDRPIYYHPFTCYSIIPYYEDYIVVLEVYYPHFHINKYRQCTQEYIEEYCMSGLYEYILRPMAKRMVYEDISIIQEYQNRYDSDINTDEDVL